MAIDGKRVINGTWGKLLLDGEEVAEVMSCQAKVNFKFSDINCVGRLATDKKVISYDGTGTIKFYHVNSRMLIKIGNALKDGKDVRFVVTSRLEDPDSFGAETVILKNVLFTDLTLIDWSSAKGGEVEQPFNFTDYEFKDLIQPQ